MASISWGAFQNRVATNPLSSVVTFCVNGGRTVQVRELPSDPQERRTSLQQFLLVVLRNAQQRVAAPLPENIRILYPGSQIAERVSGFYLQAQATDSSGREINGFWVVAAIPDSRWSPQ